jgi:hypothetical protein
MVLLDPVLKYRVADAWAPPKWPSSSPWPQGTLWSGHMEANSSTKAW